MAAQGQSFFNATGDSDAFTGSIPFPSDSPNITEVGGTTLDTPAPARPTSSETVWNWGYESTAATGSSGGISTYYAIPSYQQGISMTANQGSTTMRNVPDVALTAENVYVELRQRRRRRPVGGTSCAAPLWAAYTALINQQAAAAGQRRHRIPEPDPLHHWPEARTTPLASTTPRLATTTAAVARPSSPLSRATICALAGAPPTAPTSSMPWPARRCLRPLSSQTAPPFSPRAAPMGSWTPEKPLQSA